MHRKLAVTLAAFTLITALAVGGDAGDAKKIEGSWVATDVNIEGKKVPAEAIQKVNLVATFQGGKFKAEVSGKTVAEGTYKVDAAKKTITLSHTSGDQKGKTEPGLFKLEGDRLVTAFPAGESKDAPKDFEGGAGAEVTTFKRASGDARPNSGAKDAK